VLVPLTTASSSNQNTDLKAVANAGPAQRRLPPATEIANGVPPFAFRRRIQSLRKLVTKGEGISKHTLFSSGDEVLCLTGESAANLTSCGPLHAAF